MSSFNKVILMGNLTRDPQVRYTPSGKCCHRTRARRQSDLVRQADKLQKRRHHLCGRHRLGTHRGSRR